MQALRGSFPVVALLFIATQSTAVSSTLRVPEHFPTIQAAIDDANPGDTILVAPGEYVTSESIDFGGKAVRVISEAGAATTTIRRSNPAGNGSVVVFQSGETSAAELSGFTITGGTGTGEINPLGGGIYCIGGSSPLLANLVVVENSALYGGALYCHESHPRVVRCSLSRNVVSCGGGAYLDASSPVFEDCTLAQNRGSYASAGVHSKRGSAPWLERCRIIGNETHYGGGIDAFDASPTLVNCIVAGNLAYQGGAMYFDGGTPTLRCCTIVANRASGDSGMTSAVFTVGSTVTLQGCILWDNGLLSDAVDFSRCLVGQDPRFVRVGVFDLQRYEPIEIGGESQEIPDFVTSQPDFHLRPDSPAIDALATESAPPDDLDGTSRPCGPAPDAGAFEACFGEAPRFRRGDASGDDTHNVTDAVVVLGYLFAGTGGLTCLDAADSDDSGSLDIVDPVSLLGWLFSGGDAPPAPAQECGVDPTADSLGCASPPTCPS